MMFLSLIDLNIFQFFVNNSDLFNYVIHVCPIIVFRDIITPFSLYAAADYHTRARSGEFNLVMDQ